MTVGALPMTPLWTTSLPESLTGSMRPVFDRATSSVYVADGWGTSYASLSLRRLSIADGAVTAAVRLRAPVFSVALGDDAEHVVGATGKRLIELRRSNLEETARWDKNVPRYAHYAARSGPYALLMGWAGPSVGIFDLRSGTCAKKKVGSCQGLRRRSDGTVLILSGKQGTISSCAPASSTLRQIARPGPFIFASFSETEALVALGLGDPYVTTGNTITHSRLAQSVGLVDLNESGGSVAVEAPLPFDGLWLSADGRRLFFAQGPRFLICARDGSKLTITAEHELPEQFTPVLVVPDRSIVLGADRTSARGTVAAWRF